jgi:hypothetical protein
MEPSNHSAVAQEIESLPEAESRYLATLVERLRSRLGDRLVGVYLFGSAAYGAFTPGSSDLDVQAVVTDALAEDEKHAITASVAHALLPCPARRLELVCYTQASVNPAQRHPRFELNFNTGSDTDDHLTTDPADESSHWFLLDIAMGWEAGLSLSGPPTREVFGAIPRRWVLEGIADSLAWHAENELISDNSILNACRGWRYAVTGSFGSKRDGALWALDQPNCPPIVADALAGRQLPSEARIAGARCLMRLTGNAVNGAVASLAPPA